MEPQDDTITEKNGLRMNPESGLLPLNLMCSLYYESTFDDSFRQSAETDYPRPAEHKDEQYN